MERIKLGSHYFYCKETRPYKAIKRPYKTKQEGHTRPFKSTKLLLGPLSIARGQKAARWRHGKNFPAERKFNEAKKKSLALKTVNMVVKSRSQFSI